VGAEHTGAERVVLGQVAGARGVRGELRFRYTGDGPENLLAQSRVWLPRREGDPAPPVYRIIECGPGRAGELRVRLEGVETREAAEALRGRWVEVERASLPELPEGEFYWHELVGCRVWSHEETEIGVVRGLLETGAHDVLVVETEDGREVLLPLAEELLRELDPGAGRIVIELLPGLLETP